MLVRERARGVLLSGQHMERDAMDDFAGRIEELEIRAAESALIADLTTDWEVRTYNSRLARELRDAAACLRRDAAARKTR